MTDVDLLVLDDFSGAMADLERDGLRVLDRADHAVSMLEPGGNVVELHRSVTSCPGFFPLDADGLWSRSRTSGGLLPRLPAPEDLLVHLALHAAFQHAFVLSLGQWLDLRRVLEAGVDVPLVVDAAQRACAEGALRAALLAAAAVMGAPGHAALCDRLRPTPGLDRWLHARRGDPLRLVVPAPAPIAAARWHVAGPRRRTELLRRTLLAAPAGQTSSPLARALAVGFRALRLGRRLAARPR